MADSLLTRSYITVLVAVSVGSVLCWAILAASQYYVCSTTEDNLMSTAIALDSMRVVLAAMSVVIVQTKPDPSKRVVSTVCCMLSCGVLLGMFTSWSEACDGCMLRTTTQAEFDASVAEMFRTPLVAGNPCEGNAAASQSYWYNPESWCRESTKVNCYQQFATSNVHSIRSIQPCVRFGCTDYMPEAQWAFLVDILGDLCRVLVFYMYTTAMVGKKAQTENKEPETDAQPTQYADTTQVDSDDEDASANLKRRRPFNLTF